MNHSAELYICNGVFYSNEILQQALYKDIPFFRSAKKKKKTVNGPAPTFHMKISSCTVSAM